MRRFIRAALTSLALAMGVAAPASAGTLDQEQPLGSNEYFLGGDWGAGQVFTAGISGLLDQVDLQLASTGCDITVQIQSVTGDPAVPSGEILASETVPGESLPAPVSTAFVPIVFSDPASVVAGSQYAIMFFAPTWQCGRIQEMLWGADPDQYPRGHEVWRPTPAHSWVADPGTADFAFRTYVTPPPPPPTVDCQGVTVPSTTGTETDDNLVGTINADAIFGLGGSDELDGVDGNDCLDAGEGDDRASGGADDDLVKGGDGRDRVRGVGGEDRLKGQGGEDRVNGGEGSDKLSGGRGDDKLRGGAAKDRYKGNAGDDDLNAVDAKRDRVNCGTGDDKAVVDPIDRVSRNCEIVREVEKD